MSKLRWIFTISIISFCLSCTPIQAQSVDLREFITPQNYTGKHVLSGSYGTECVRYENIGNCPDGTAIRMWKNENWEQFCVRPDGIYRQEDTSGGTDCPGDNGTTITSNYALTSCTNTPLDADPGAKWANTTASLGETWSHSCHNVVKVLVNRTEGVASIYRDPKTAKYAQLSAGTKSICGGLQSNLTNVTGTLQKIFPAGTYTYANGQKAKEEVIQIYVNSVQETYFYEKGRGMVGFQVAGESSGVVALDPLVCPDGGPAKTRIKKAPDHNNGPNLSYNYGYGYTKTAQDLDPSTYTQWYDGRTSPNNSKAGKPVTLDPNADDYSTNFASGSKTQLGSGYVYDEIALVQPRRYLDLTITALNKDKIISSIQSLHHDFSGFTPNYRQFYENMVGPNLNTYLDLPKNQEENKRRTFDYQSGINAQAISEKNNSDKDLNDWLCRLGASWQGNAYLADGKTRPVADEEISCGDGCTAADLTKFLPNGDINWQETNLGTYKPYRASTVYCALKPSCPGSYGQQSIDCSRVTPVNPDSDLFTVLKTKLKKKIAVSEDTTSKAFLQSCVEINDPADEHPKNCEDLMLDPSTRSKYGLPDLLPKPGDETASNRISKVDWGKMDNKTKNNILKLYKDKSGYFYHSMPNSCRLCMVTPGSISNASRAKAATDVAISFMPANYLTTKDKIKNVDYGHATPEQAVETDKQAPIGIINQPAPNIPLFRYSPANKSLLGQIQELLTRAASFAPNVLCSLVTTTFGEGELGKDPQTGEPTKASSHSFNLCKTTYSIPIDTTLYASKDLQLYSKNGQTYYMGLAPQKYINRVQKARNGKTLLDNTDIQIKLTDSGQMPSEHDFGKADLMGGDLAGSSAQIRDADKMEGSTIYLNESIDDYSCLTRSLLPASWQNGDWSNLYSKCPNI